MSGSTDHIIRIYQMTPGPPERIATLDFHRVSSLFSRFMYGVLIYYLSRTTYTVIGCFSGRYSCLTSWCAFQLDSISKRYNKHPTNLVWLVL